jgi:hypothetical protein
MDDKLLSGNAQCLIECVLDNSSLQVAIPEWVRTKYPGYLHCSFVCLFWAMLVTRNKDLLSDSVIGNYRTDLGYFSFLMTDWPQAHINRDTSYESSCE